MGIGFGLNLPGVLADRICDQISVVDTDTREFEEVLSGPTSVERRLLVRGSVASAP
jgi:hypothetical protein